MLCRQTGWWWTEQTDRDEKMSAAAGQQQEEEEEVLTILSWVSVWAERRIISDRKAVCWNTCKTPREIQYELA